MRPLAVTLDAAGTLFKPANAVSQTYATMARPYGGELDVGTLGSSFGRAFSRMPPMAFQRADADTLDRLERGWWRQLVKQVSDEAGGVTDFDGYFSALYEHFRQADAWVLYPEVLGILETLKTRGVPMVVVSNFDSRLLDVLAGLDITMFFEDIIFSTGARSAKPERGIFDLAVSVLDVPARDVLHVGDNVEADYHGARAAGLSALLVVRGSAQSGDEIESIESLEGIADRL
jgi:putative hydrolase of the HAD superfamily